MANGIDFIVDTNVLIYAMEGHRITNDILLCSPGISVISEIEMLGRKGITQDEVNDIRNLLNGFEIITFSDIIKDITIFFKQKYSIKSFDAIIAATAKSLNMQLVTADKDFTKIKEIDIVLLDLNS
jgi:predicted nucleic acid-binding protein